MDSLGQRLAFEARLGSLDAPGTATLEHPLDDLGVLGLGFRQQVDRDRGVRAGEEAITLRTQPVEVVRPARAGAHLAMQDPAVGLQAR